MSVSEKIRPSRVAIACAAAVVVFCFLCWSHVLPFKPDEQAALFTGLGFVGVVAAFLHDRQRASESNVEHAELIAALKAQALASLEAARIHAASAKLDRLEKGRDFAHEHGRPPRGWHSLRDFLDTADSQINALSEIVDKAIGIPQDD